MKIAEVSERYAISIETLLEHKIAVYENVLLKNEQNILDELSVSGF